MLIEDSANRIDRDEQPEISQIQDGVALSPQQIRKIFEGYVAGACGLANIFCDLADGE